MKFLKSKKGFTLIELLVVIAIIGILAAVVVLAINPVQMMQKSRDAERKSDMAALSKAIDIYMTDTAATAIVGGASANQNTYNPTNCCSGTAGTCTGPTNTATGGWLVPYAASCGVDLGNYIAKIPTDPTNNATYHYHYRTSTTTNKYVLETILEYPSATSWKVGTDISL